MAVQRGGSWEMTGHTREDDAIVPRIEVPVVEVPHIEIVAVDDAWCGVLPPEGNVKQRNYRLLASGVRAYTPTGDVHTSPAKRKMVPMYESAARLAPPREQLLALLRPGDDVLAAVVRPAERRAASPLPDDSRRYLQRALLSPSPPLWAASPEPRDRATSPMRLHMDGGEDGARSLADELREAERAAAFRAPTPLAAHDRRAPHELMARLAVSREDVRISCNTEEREEGVRGGGTLRSAGARLDALLREARALHAELAAAQRDLQVLAARHARR